ncbi:MULTISPECIES: HetZ-related protein 2 [Leptolyngbya]|uniref:HetZ-related protein 2 n=1 Tax=Leptolyngbya TaxID=47251 RepID=UPI001688F718|nr:MULTISPECIES: HetZ-related protein 2 [unclassified Leptolyngbya]MBD1857267.1 HetZ-related protein 2 [Leptolyngbya sp. FACHB-1624]MBN8562131.1 HetZ-related protein 2 [Leptolyngbya sp. UWPOB_LEPTO1]MCY6493318.1 HetZ-related protein 2 [Leptolyngbya sp. GGD]
MTYVEQIAEDWRSRLKTELPRSSETTRESIVQWLLGDDLDRFETYTAERLDIEVQAMDYRYRILVQRYFETPPQRAYKNLMQRLGSMFVIRNKINTWIALSRDRQTTVVDVLQEVIQDLLQNDNYMQQQVKWIAECTSDPRLRNAIVLTATEEYCLRPIRNQPLLVYRFVNFQKRTQRGGMTQVPAADFIRLVSEEITSDDAEGTVSLLDGEAIAQFQEAEAQQQQQELRGAIARQFEDYLTEKVGEDAAQWLRFYLQGKTQEAIAQMLDMPIKQVYRLREKVNYHAVRVFAQKSQPELVTEWLGR